MDQLKTGNLLDEVQNKPNTKLVLYQLLVGYMQQGNNHFDFYNITVENEKNI